MTTLDIAQAEDEADELWDEMMDALTPEQRAKAMSAAYIAFGDSLAEQGCWLPDVFARAAQLDWAVAEWRDQATAIADEHDPSQPTH